MSWDFQNGELNTPLFLYKAPGIKYFIIVTENRLTQGVKVRRANWQDRVELESDHA